MVVAAIALVCAAASVSPAVRPIRGLSLDILTALRWEMFGGRQDPATSPTVVVAIDEESLRTAPFKGSPMLTWTGEIGRVLAATLEGGAKVVGFDVVIPTSIEQSEIPFGEGMLGEKVRGFDRDFLRALAGASTTGKVVLGEMLGGNQPVRPSPGQRIAVRQQQNIRPLNVHIDHDDVVRRLPLTFTVDGTRVPSMARRTGVARARRRARIRQERQDDAGRLPDSGPGAEHDDAQFRGRRRRHSDLLVCRPAQLRRQERQGLFPALVRRQGRHLRHGSGHRRSPA